jgi:phosphoserine aminotransferase
MSRIYNFGAGPAILPEPVLEEAAAGVVEINGSGMSVLEISHRGKDYEAIHEPAQADLLDLLGLSGDEYKVMFIQGGASMQFAMLPMNLLPSGTTAYYVNAGVWGSKAIKEAQKVNRGKPVEIASSADKNFSYIPKNLNITPGAQYLHITTNNTIEGTELFDLPNAGDVPLVSDSSSDFLALNRDHGKFSMIYAGAQKNAGPAGVAIVVARRDFIAKSSKDVPAILSYGTYADKDSLYNTPPCFAIYVVGLVAKWLKAKGGLSAMEQENRLKAGKLYSAIDAVGEVFFATVSAQEDRSLMNVTFRLQPKYESLEKDFLKGAQEMHLDGLKGHRNVGGFRASIYNAFPAAGVDLLTDYITEFARKSG